MVVERSVGAARGQCRVIGQHRADADHDRVGLRAAAVHVGARLRTGDPLAGAVGCRGTAVQALRPLDRDVRAAEPLHRQPRGEQGGGLLLEESGLDLDAGAAQALRSAAGLRVRVGNRVDHPGDAGRQERFGARPGASGVVAGLERHDRGRPAGIAVRQLRQRVDLGVHRTRTAVPAFGEHCAVGREDHRADLGVHAARALEGERQRAPHGVALRGVHRHPNPSFRLREWRTAARSRRSCCLPSGLAAETCCITVGSGIPPDQPRRHPHRMLMPQLADCHRRFGFTPTPEHVMHLILVNA